MGFQVPRKTARLQFEGDEFDNCEVIFALDLTLEATDHMDSLREAEDSKAALDFFVENCILSWNLEDADANALPITVESLLQFPSWFALLVMNGYTAAAKEASEVSGPLGKPSKNGSTSAERSGKTARKSKLRRSSSGRRT